MTAGVLIGLVLGVPLGAAAALLFVARLSSSFSPFR